MFYDFVLCNFNQCETALHQDESESALQGTLLQSAVDRGWVGTTYPNGNFAYYCGKHATLCRYCHKSWASEPAEEESYKVARLSHFCSPTCMHLFRFGW